MIKIENTEAVGFEAAIRGCRNPLNSWDRADSYNTYIENPDTGNIAKFEFFMGDNDHELAMRLAKSGSTHAKYRRMILVYADVTAPLYWWKEADTYRVGVEKNSCSTMHKIHDKEFSIDDFSHEHLVPAAEAALQDVISELNVFRDKFRGTNDKKWWWQLIQLLPSSYNQKRTVMLSYEALSGIYRDRKDHKLDEWRSFCEWIESLPYSELITCSYED